MFLLIPVQHTGIFPSNNKERIVSVVQHSFGPFYPPTKLHNTSKCHGTGWLFFIPPPPSLRSLQAARLPPPVQPLFASPSSWLRISARPPHPRPPAHVGPVDSCCARAHQAMPGDVRLPPLAPARLPPESTQNTRPRKYLSS
jgi:hypothetical protein